MTIIYFLIDICFYNYTSINTNLILLSLLNKKEKIYSLFLIILIDILLNLQGHYFFISLILYFFNQKIKLSYINIKDLILRYFINYTLYLILVLIIFHTWNFQILGILIDLLFIFLHKIL